MREQTGIYAGIVGQITEVTGDWNTVGVQWTRGDGTFFRGMATPEGLERVDNETFDIQVGDWVQVFLPRGLVRGQVQEIQDRTRRVGRGQVQEVRDMERAGGGVDRMARVTVEYDDGMQETAWVNLNMVRRP
jgi:hypothetical protein